MMVKIQIDKLLDFYCWDSYILNIMALKFEWDKRKNRANQKKHGVSFEEAETVFYDDYARLISDPDHSEDEDRFILLGLSNRPRMLAVVHCYRQNDEVIRIISARKATRNEEYEYTRRK